MLQKFSVIMAESIDLPDLSLLLGGLLFVVGLSAHIFISLSHNLACGACIDSTTLMLSSLASKGRSLTGPSLLVSPASYSSTSMTTMPKSRVSSSTSRHHSSSWDSCSEREGSTPSKLHYGDSLSSSISSGPWNSQSSKKSKGTWEYSSTGSIGVSVTLVSS